MHVDRFPVIHWRWFRRNLCLLLLLPLIGCASQAARDSGRLSDTRPQYGRTFNDCGGAGWCPTMVVVPAGRYVMGADAKEPGFDPIEGPQRTVTVGRFAAGVFDVTRGEWAAFAEATHRAPSLGCAWDGRAQMEADPKGSWRDLGFAQDDRHPVVCIDWQDVQAYLAWLARKTGQPYRLLTEAEWEYAARAGSTTMYPWGDIATHERANYGNDTCCSPLASGRDQWRYTSPVDAFPANAFGLHDMHGNVLQWVQDCFAGSLKDLPIDGSAYLTDATLSMSGDLSILTGTKACSYRMLRGGDWGDPPRMVRSGSRNFSPPPGESADFRSGGVGFRVARSLP